jgi:hypothetical protein
MHTIPAATSFLSLFNLNSRRITQLSLSLATEDWPVNHSKPRNARDGLKATVIIRTSVISTVVKSPPAAKATAVPPFVLSITEK